MPEFLYIIHVYRETEEVKSLKNENVFDNNNTKTKLTTATTVHSFHTVGIIEIYIIWYINPWLHNSVQISDSREFCVDVICPSSSYEPITFLSIINCCTLLLLKLKCPYLLRLLIFPLLRDSGDTIPLATINSPTPVSIKPVPYVSALQNLLGKTLKSTAKIHMEVHIRA